MRGLELVPHIVVLAVGSTLQLREPVVADHGEDEIRRRDGAFDRLGPVEPWLDRVHVHEQLVVAVALAEPFVQSARVGGRIAAPVVDEDARDGFDLRVLQRERRTQRF
jgi:hypothetical protein